MCKNGRLSYSLAYNLSTIDIDCWVVIVNVQRCRLPKGVPWVCYRGIYKNLNINLIWPGKDLSLGRYLILVCVYVCFVLCFLKHMIMAMLCICFSVIFHQLLQTAFSKRKAKGLK